MDANAIMSLIGTLGFPIVCCGALFWFVNKTLKEFSDKVDKSMQNLSDSIADNTTATVRLCTEVEVLTKIGGESNGTGQPPLLG